MEKPKSTDFRQRTPFKTKLISNLGIVKNTIGWSTLSERRRGEGDISIFGLAYLKCFFCGFVLRHWLNGDVAKRRRGRCCSRWRRRRGGRKKEIRQPLFPEMKQREEENRRDGRREREKMRRRRR
ncbi:hypothetical protein HAX54_051334 [Datura stramonium]|uniref:Uncharacterized protein n=1 Tax=Datura stramonium TaxID=4076 RepID=A0ABS8SZ76_DATST|nr:hypothetical protein [Datura stramonium]